MPELNPIHTLHRDEHHHWLGEQLETPDRESASGFHFTSAYTENPYGWYLKYIRGYTLIFTKRALIKGAALHKAAEAAYLFHNRDDCLATYIAVMRHRKEEYEHPDHYLEDVDTGKLMLAKWYDTWVDQDFEEYHIVAVEQQWEVPLRNGFTMTVRPDQVLQRKSDGKFFLKDIKSTGWSITNAHEYLAGGDQSTSYQWAFNRMFPDLVCGGLISDIMYKNRSVVKAERPGIIVRSGRYMEEFEMGTIGALMEMSQKVKALSEGWPAHILFRRNGKDESFFGSEWPDVYRADLPSMGEAPYGYKIDTWAQERAKAVLENIEITGVNND